MSSSLPHILPPGIAPVVNDERIMRMLLARRDDLVAQREAGMVRVATLQYGNHLFVHIVRTAAGRYWVFRYALAGFEWEVGVDARDSNADVAFKALERTFQ